MALGGCGLLLEFDCEDRVLSEAPSPDGAWVATTFRRNCGATTSYMTHVALRESGSRFAGEGQVFVAKHERDVFVAWTAPDRLTVSCVTCAPAEVSTRQPAWRTVTVEHR